MMTKHKDKDTTPAVAQAMPVGIVATMAAQYGMDPVAFDRTLRATVMPANTTREQQAAFLLVARRYDLDPLARHIYAFPARGGGIQPIIGVDGWLHLIINHPQMDGWSQEELRDDDGNVTAVRTTIWRKDWTHPCVKTSYMSECRMNTEIWKKLPVQMLGHRSMILCGRYAFGLKISGALDEDDALRMGYQPGVIIPSTASVERSPVARLQDVVAEPATDIGDAPEVEQQNSGQETNPFTAPGPVGDALFE